MKILLVSGSFPPMACGVGDYTSRLAEALGCLPNMTVAVLTSVGARLPGPNASYRLLSIEDGWHIEDTTATIRAVREFAPDVVHFQFPARGYGRAQWVLPGVLRWNGFKIFLTLHEYFEARDARSLLAATMFIPNLLSASAISVTIRDYRERLPCGYRWILRTKPVRHIPIASSIDTTHLSEEERRIVRQKFGVAKEGEALIAYFGFVSPPKGVELLFEIADPLSQKIVLACELSESDPYHRLIAEKLNTPPWKGRVEVTGFLDGAEVGRLLAASDAVIFPFRDGIKVGHSSLEAALAQGTFTLTTSRYRNGYDSEDNTYYAHPGDVPELSNALKSHMGKRISRTQDHTSVRWRNVAEAHLDFYSSVLFGTERGK